MHQLMANRLRDNPARLSKARSFIDRQLASCTPPSRHWAKEWQQLIDGPFDMLLEFMVERSERADQMRKSNPFAGLIASAERWAIIRATRTA